MNGITVHAKTVEVGLAPKDGQMVIVDKDDKSAMAWVNIAADISPTIYSPDDYEIEAVFMVNPYTGADETLTGELETVARSILETNSEWCSWALEELADRAEAA